MQIIVVGGGPVGIFTGMALARRGHDIILVDRDPGPAADASWTRAGVMQFDHPHAYRPAVRQALLAELPDVLDALKAAGAREHRLPFQPEEQSGLFCRRSVVERVLRAAARREPNLRWVTGHVDRLRVVDGVAEGVIVDGIDWDADAVVVASGRSSRLGDDLRGAVEGGSCGFVYVSRMYRAREPQWACELPLPSAVDGDGYQSLVMPQDDATHSLLFCWPARASDDLAALRTPTGFEHAAATVPNLAPWRDPERFEPITEPLVGGHLTNTYRLQGPALGLPPARGLFFLGDTVVTTNPAAGHGLALALGHARQLLDTIADDDQALLDASLALDVWAETHVRPWFLDHVRWDRTLLERFAGKDLDLADRIPSDVICSAAAVEPSLFPVVGPYLGMAAGPDALLAAEPRVRELLADGWRPTFAGPPRHQLLAGVGAGV